jgi:hypothetical protein
MAHVLAFARYPVAKMGDLIPIHYIEALEQNQQIASCCRHPENHMLEAYYSDEDEAATGRPNIYRFICTEFHDGSVRPNGERWHDRFCVGHGDVRPMIEVR